MKKLFVLVIMLGLFAFTNVYAEDVLVNENNQVVVENGTAEVDTDGNYSIDDEELMDAIMGILPEGTEIVDDVNEMNRDTDIALNIEGETDLEDQRSDVLTALISVILIIAVLVAAMVVLAKRTKKTA